MNAATYNILVPRGADLDFTLTINDSDDVAVDFTGSTFKAEIREGFKTPLLASFVFETLSGAGNSDVNSNLLAGQVRFILTAEESKKLIDRKYEWDFFWTDSVGTIFKLLAGSVKVVENITNV